MGDLNSKQRVDRVNSCTGNAQNGPRVNHFGHQTKVTSCAQNKMSLILK